METLREYRKRHGLTLAQLSAQVRISEGQLSRIERTGKASLTTALELQKLTGIPAEKLAEPCGNA